MREFDDAEAEVEVGLREDCGEDLLDVGSNVDLYVANQNQETVDSIYEVHVGDALFASFNGFRFSQDLYQFRSLSLD